MSIPAEGKTPKPPSPPWYEVLTHRRFWVGLGAGAVVAVVAGYVWLVVRPQEPAPDFTAEDIISAWNDSIHKLGITAVYPPQEDMMVGDIWAVIVSESHKPMLGKSTRIGHINLRAEIGDGDSIRPIFADTKPPTPDETYRTLDFLEAKRKDNPDHLLLTSLAAFPYITITHAVQSAGGVGVGGFGLGGTRSGQQIEQVRIKGVETYGAPSLPAYQRFVEWCAEDMNNILCKDDHAARKLLALAVDPEVGKDESANRIELHLITRVFLTREIETRRWMTDSRGAVIELATEPANTDLKTPEIKVDSTNAKDGVPPSVTISAPALPGTGVRAARGSTAQLNELAVGINGVFQKPLVFGYRSLATMLPLAQSKPDVVDTTAQTEKR